MEHETDQTADAGRLQRMVGRRVNEAKDRR